MRIIKRLIFIIVITIMLSSCAGRRTMMRIDEKIEPEKDVIITQVTNNSYPDVGVEIYGSKLAWQAIPGGSSDPEIFYYNGKHVQQVTFNDVYDCTPSISSGGIAWQAYRLDGGSDVFFCDFNTVKRITNDTTDDYRVTIYYNKIIWCKHKRIDGQIMLYDGSNVTPVTKAYGIFPRISSGGIMYSDVRDNGHLYLYDWNDIVDLGETDFEYTQSPHNQQINGDKLVWRKHVTGFHEVFLYDISTGITTQITNKEFNPEMQTYQPSVSGDYIAWRNRRDNMDYLRLYDGKQISTIASARTIDNAYFGDGFLVWSMGTRDKDIEVFIYNLKSKEIIQITDDNCPDRYPIASGKCIAWQRYDGTDYEIYLAHILSP